MSKKSSEQKLLAASLSNALNPQKKRGMPKEALDLYDERPSQSGIPSTVPTAIPQAIPDAIPTSIPEPTPSQPKAKAEQFTYLDATHTASEKSVYSVMYRETVSKGTAERHFGPAELMKKTGIRSRNTVHKALYGLADKLSIEVISEARGNPAGPRYRVYRWQEVEERRRAAGMTIDPQTKQITARGIPEGIPTAIPPAITKDWDSGIAKNGIPGIPNIGTVINKEEVLSSQRPNDDEAAPLARALSQVERELTGKATTDALKWEDLASVLITELKIAAGRTTVSSVPAFLAEHLRRRLWKKEKRDIERDAAEGTPQGDSVQMKADSKDCPDCFGTGMFYPEGFDKGVARCSHQKLSKNGEGK